jgi:hypothetical protein
MPQVLFHTLEPRPPLHVSLSSGHHVDRLEGKGNFTGPCRAPVERTTTLIRYRVRYSDLGSRDESLSCDGEVDAGHSLAASSWSWKQGRFYDPRVGSR